MVIDECYYGEAMVITLTGENSLGIRRRLEQLCSDFIKEHGELALEKIDAEEIEAEMILEAAASLPFLAQRKMLVIKNLSRNKRAAELIEQIIYSAGDNTEVILYEPSTDKRTSFFKTLKSKTQLEEYHELDNAGLAKWLVGEAKKLDSSISLSDAQFLVERAGQEQLRLAGELQKLTTYNPKIDRSSIELLVEEAPQSKVFELLDAAFSGSKKRALKLYDEQRAQKVEPQAILAMLAWQLQLVILAKKAGSRSSAQIAKDTGMSPYPVQKSLVLARRIDDDKLKKMAAEALHIDLLAKKSLIDVDEAIKAYIIGL